MYIHQNDLRLSLFHANVHKNARIIFEIIEGRTAGPGRDPV